MRKLLFVDTETTGLNPEYHELRQIAGKYIEYDDKLTLLEGLQDPKVSKQFNWFIKPDHLDRIGQTLRDKFGITDEMFDDPKYKSQLDVFKRFHTSIKDKVDPFNPVDKIYMAGHNVAEFDYRFIRQWWERSANELCMEKCFFGSYFHWSCLDTKSLLSFAVLDSCGKLQPPKKNHLTGLCEHFNIKLAEKDAHDALADISATEEVIKKLLTQIDKNYSGD